MKNTTLCYIRKDDSYLMLYRNRKKHDENAGKWIGVGGKIKENESPEECLVREVFEETGLQLKTYQFRGVITFVSDRYETEYMFLYEGLSYEGTLRSECNEGELAWVRFSDIPSLSLWEGDRVFLPELIGGNNQMHIKLVYKGDELAEVLRQD